MKLHNMKKIKKVRRSKKRGRGYASGRGGHTVGYGQKGQKSRTGFKRLRSWIRESKVTSLPKLRGIGKRSSKRSYHKSKVQRIIISVSDLQNMYRSGDTIDLDSLRKRFGRSSTKKNELKVLGNGDIKKKLTLIGIPVSDKAKEKIEKAGGKVK